MVYTFSIYETIVYISPHVQVPEITAFKSGPLSAVRSTERDFSVARTLTSIMLSIPLSFETTVYKMIICMSTPHIQYCDHVIGQLKTQ